MYTTKDRPPGRRFPPPINVSARKRITFWDHKAAFSVGGRLAYKVLMTDFESVPSHVD
jgi:hypothetical protein